MPLIDFFLNQGQVKVDEHVAMYLNSQFKDEAEAWHEQIKKRKDELYKKHLIENMCEEAKLRLREHIRISAVKHSVEIKNSFSELKYPSLFAAARARPTNFVDKSMTTLCTLADPDLGVCNIIGSGGSTLSNYKVTDHVSVSKNVQDLQKDKITLTQFLSQYFKVGK